MRESVVATDRQVFGVSSTVKPNICSIDVRELVDRALRKQPRPRPTRWERDDMSNRTCSIEGCNRPFLAKNMCSMHWQRAYRTGIVGNAESLVRTYNDTSKCSVDGCNLRPVGKGFCSIHWTRWKKYGDPLILKQAPNGIGNITTRGYVMLSLKSHPLATSHGSVFQHRVILYNEIGPGTHPCHWCGISISWDKTWPIDKDALVVDHLDGNRTNNVLSNLVPTCNTCNDKRKVKRKVKRNDSIK